jgi:RNA methyltransferase, TrmH family
MAITSRSNPLVARFRDAANGDGAVVLLDGAHLVADAIAAGAAIAIAAVTTASRGKPEIAAIADALAQRGVEVAIVGASVMNAISPVRSPSGIVAIADRPARRVADVFARDVPLVVVAIDVQDPGNVGAIVRAAEAAGATGVVAAGASADPFGWKALRGSMGSALRLPVAIAADADEPIDEARRRGCRVVATVPRDGNQLFETDLSGPVALLVGGEGAGLPPSLAAGAATRVTIPMQPPVESLNAAVTAAVILYEAYRQRHNSLFRRVRY